MVRRNRQWDESDVRIRPGKGSRPRTKKRPAHNDAKFGMVITKDRGRWSVVLHETATDPDTEPTTITCMRARQLGRTPIEVGDEVGVVGDTSGRPGSLARIVKVKDRTSVLRRTADDTDPYERIVVANADQLLIVCAVADPPPRAGFVERALIAAYAGNISPILCLTKSDLGDPSQFASEFEALDLPVMVCGIHDDLEPLNAILSGRTTALIGHSGVGKSTLVNRLIADACRVTGSVSGVGKGRHTSTQSVALRLDSGDGWVIDTPGIRSFGLAHITPDDVLTPFADLADAATDCPRGCSHLGPPADPECALDDLEGTSARRAQTVRQLLASLRSNNSWELKNLASS